MLTARPHPQDTGMDKIEIADSALNETTKCERGFKCLSANNSCLCEVDDSSKLPLIL